MKANNNSFNLTRFFFDKSSNHKKIEYLLSSILPGMVFIATYIVKVKQIFGYI